MNPNELADRIEARGSWPTGERDIIVESLRLTAAAREMFDQLIDFECEGFISLDGATVTRWAEELGIAWEGHNHDCNAEEEEPPAPPKHEHVLMWSYSGALGDKGRGYYHGRCFECTYTETTDRLVAAPTVPPCACCDSPATHRDPDGFQRCELHRLGIAP